MAAAPKAAAPKKTPAAAAGVAGSNYPVIKDKAAIAAAAGYAESLAQIKVLEAALKPLKRTILDAMGDAPQAAFGTHIVSQTIVEPLAGTPNTIITKEMVGQIIPGKAGKAGYTQIRVQ